MELWERGGMFIERMSLFCTQDNFASYCMLRTWPGFPFVEQQQPTACTPRKAFLTVLGANTQL